MVWSPTAWGVLVAIVLVIIAVAHRMGMVAADRRARRHARRFFVLGFLCGFVSFPVLRERRRGLRLLRAVIRSRRAPLRRAVTRSRCLAAPSRG